MTFTNYDVMIAFDTFFLSRWAVIPPFFINVINSLNKTFVSEEDSVTFEFENQLELTTFVGLLTEVTVRL